MNGARDRGRTAGDNVVVIERAVRSERAAGCQHLLLRQPVVIELGAGDTHAHGPIFAHRLADRGDYPAQEAQAIVEAAAVTVLAPVDTRVQELGRQVAVAGDDLHPVHAGCRHTPRAGAIAFDDFIDEPKG